MRKGTKIALAAGALILAGAAGISSLAIAGSRGAGGWGHHGQGHHSGMRHGMRHGMRGHRMLERFDTNKDSKLTQEELDDARKKLLASHDGDKDGKLTLAEFEKLWLEVKRRQMVRGFQRLDHNGDASVTLDEFLKPFADLVARMDSNDDGVLDREDHRRHMRGKMGSMMGHGGGMLGKGGGMGQGGGMGKRGG